MNNWLHLRRFLLLAAIALMTAALGACSSENEPTPSGGGDAGAEGVAGRLALRISMGDIAGAGVSRAAGTPSDGTYNPGSGYENYIDLESAIPDYRVYVFDAADDRFIFSPDAAEVVRAENTTISSRDYELYFPLSEARCTQLRDCANGFKIALLANWRGAYPVLTPGQSTVASIASSVDAVMEWMPRGAIASAADRTPMFGIRHVAGADFRPSGETTWVGTLFLLRSIAKVEVIDANFFDPHPVKGPVISDVKLVRYSTRTVMAPEGINHQDQYVTGSWFSDYVDKVTIPAGNYVTDDVIAFSNPVDGHWFIYCPEYDNSREGERTYLQITYEYPERSPKTFTVDFREYGVTDESKYFDIKRNTWYKFTLNLPEYEDVYTVDVLPFGVFNLDPVHGVLPGDDKLPYMPVYDPVTGELDCWENSAVPGEFWAIDLLLQVPSPYLPTEKYENDTYTVYTAGNGIVYYYHRKRAEYRMKSNPEVIVPSPFLPILDIYPGDPNENPEIPPVTCYVMITKDGEILWFFDPLEKTYYDIYREIIDDPLN